MELLYASDLTARLWTAGLFLLAALAPVPLLLGRRRDEERSGAAGVVATLAFGLWAGLVVVALVTHWDSERASTWQGVLLAVALAVVPVGLFLTALIAR